MTESTTEDRHGTAAKSGPARGIITVAFGSERYLRMARLLAESLDLHAPDLPRALVTDSTDRKLTALYDYVLPYQPEWGKGWLYKLHLNDCSPFRETLYIDCDCIVVGGLDHIWRLFADIPFGVEGRQVSDGEFVGDVAERCSSLGVESIPRFNGGMYYFDDSDAAAAVFDTARGLMSRYDELGLQPHARGISNDEPVVSMALATHGIRAVDDGGTTMRTPIDIRGPLHIDVLRGY